MATKVMLVEDDPRIGQVLSLGLQDLGYAVLLATTGTQALEVARSRPADVVLLDLMLPDLDGIEVCRRLRAMQDVPIIMVTARSDSTDVIEGLEAGADDYVTKPVVAGVLSARIKAVLRRAAPERGTLRVGALEIRPAEAVVTRRGQPVPLTKTEYRLLCELAEDRGSVKTREDLLRKVWGYDYFGDTRLLDVHIRRLRTKVEDDPGEPRLILTVRGTGYRLAREPVSP